MMQNSNPITVGIDDISVYIPSLYLDIEDLANARGIDPAKLKKGLGLEAIAMPDASEDVITMAAEALIELIENNALKPMDIGRIYVGTESMIDGSKPIASYLLGILERYCVHQKIDTKGIRNIDVVDMTFACIGAVDALHNSLDWIRLNPEKKAIIVSTDWAKYDMRSPGECTQGAGAIAILASADPGLISIDKHWGIATKCEHDFFKPQNPTVDLADMSSSNGLEAYQLGRQIRKIVKDTPVYDGHFSNQCYTQRVHEAFDNFIDVSGSEGSPLDKWKQLIFHLPYAYHARRIFVEIYKQELKRIGNWQAFASQFHLPIESNGPEETKTLNKAISKTEAYNTYVESHISPGERASSLVGNMYTGSIFLGLVSSLLVSEEEDLTGQNFGFIAYGSGSKSKVFQGTVMPDYKSRLQHWDLFKKLQDRIRIDINDYEYLHRGKLLINLDSADRKVYQTSSGWMETNRYARNYNVQ